MNAGIHCYPLGLSTRRGFAVMKWFKDIHDRRIRLTSEREEHIEDSHPEMSGQIDRIQDVLVDPDVIVRSRTDPSVELFYRPLWSYARY
jgi:hypothetical protein